jgi:hypothetical protein
MATRGKLTAETDRIRRSLYLWLKEQPDGEMPSTAPLAIAIGAIRPGREGTPRADTEAVCQAFAALQSQGLISLRGGGQQHRGHRLVVVHATKTTLRTAGCPFETL